MLSPLTLIAGPVAAYNVAAVLMPALAAWTAFLLCRLPHQHVLAGAGRRVRVRFLQLRCGTRRPRAAEHDRGFPAAAHCPCRPALYNDELTGIGVVLRLGPLIAFQLLLSTEIAFTLTLALVAALTFCVALIPERRRRVGTLLPFLLGGYALAAVLTEPFLYVVAVPGSSGLGQNDFVSDLANFVGADELHPGRERCRVCAREELPGDHPGPGGLRRLAGVARGRAPHLGATSPCHRPFLPGVLRRCADRPARWGTPRLGGAGHGLAMGARAHLAGVRVHPEPPGLRSTSHSSPGSRRPCGSRGERPASCGISFRPSPCSRSR